MAKYTLPDLAYDYGALEPHVSGKIMELHHDKHHAAYVKGANETLATLEEARAKNDVTRVASLEQALAFHVSGHVLHSLFWQNLTPGGGGKPGGDFGQAIVRDFGTFDAFKAQFIATAMTINGSGWAALMFDPLSRRLLTAQIHDHESRVTQGSVPLMVLDAWEHAYYLQYFNDKAKFFAAAFNLWNWQDIAERYNLALRVDLGLDSTTDAAITAH